MFRLRADAERWFRRVAGQGPLRTKLDLYYLCLMAGLAAHRLDEEAGGTEIYGQFTQEFEGSRFQILALLITAELRREGLDIGDKDAVQSLVQKYIAADSPAALTPAGFARLNAYASGGFNVLVESFEDQPQDVNVFLARYTRMINQSSGS